MYIIISWSGLWGTTLMENTSNNRELFVRTTLRELLVYVVFLVDICLCKSATDTKTISCSLQFLLDIRNSFLEMLNYIEQMVNTIILVLHVFFKYLSFLQVVICCDSCVITGQTHSRVLYRIFIFVICSHFH